MTICFFYVVLLHDDFAHKLCFKVFKLTKRDVFKDGGFFRVDVSDLHTYCIFYAMQGFEGYNIEGMVYICNYYNCIISNF